MYAFESLLLGTKILYFLRGYKTSGFLINMIFQVLDDMKSFLIIILTVTVSFGAAFFLLQREFGDIYKDEDKSATDMMFSTYIILLGENEVPDSFLRGWVKFVFLIYTVFNLIIMLNLLIAVISDTFDRVKDSSDRARNMELLKLIVEYKQVINDTGSESTWIYIFGHRVDSEEKNEIIGEWRGRIQEISRAVRDSQDSLEKKIAKIPDVKDVQLRETQNQKQITDIKNQLNVLNQKLVGEEEKVRAHIDKSLESQRKEINELLIKNQKETLSKIADMLASR
mmetsp:Transcript_55787/g.63675  ORF Transcript_55787/g.63675 Transcript_55787/m.63675 type:complete len:282 (-) Transcript_55787:88-933(-)